MESSRSYLTIDDDVTAFSDEITATTRKIVVDWMHDVCLELADSKLNVFIQAVYNLER